ncbi:Ribonuclease H domain [Arabidopsis suecica]|uniref:Ribonuclease H domain n=1 Tax=Arabidopsis suecica TaxID=45249 RepID=A0A8T1YP46_ARASU|nr:Ribonuclease H domain [Arabidopsis suecica]
MTGETESGDSRVPVLETQDAPMTDVGDGGRPPGDPPDVSGSWVAKVSGNVGGRLLPERIMDDGFVMERMQLEFPDGVDGEPVITIGREVLETMNGLWKQCIIVKVLGRNIALPALSRRLREMWSPKGGMHVMDLPRQFFMIRFDLEEEYMMALTGGPWRAFGSHLMVQAWSPDFDPLRDEIVTTPVWVRLSNLPVNFYHKAILLGIARGLGKPIKVDVTTLNFERARFARVCVEVDMSKPLKGTVMVNGERYFVAYEGLSNICSGCGIYGHLVHNCPRRVVEKTVDNVCPNIAGKSIVTKEKDDGFTVVRRAGRRGSPPENRITPAAVPATQITEQNMERSLKEISQNQGSVDIAISNSFGMLDEDMISSDLREVAIISQENKENEYIPKQAQKNKSAGQGVVHAGPKQLINGSGSGKEGFKSKRAEVSKPKEKNGSRIKVQKQGRPTRGLVFGPTRDEVMLSESGKRLRVEHTRVGRAGGVVIAGGGDSASDNHAGPMGGVKSGEVASGSNPITEMAAVPPGGEGNQTEVVLCLYINQSMNCLLWNCRGANKPNFRRSIRYILKKFPTDMLAVFETHAGGDRARQICHGLGFDNSFRVDATGQSGGLWLLWRSDVGEVEILESSDQFIHAKVTQGEETMHLVAVYAAPTVSGDFNTIVRVDERTGGNGQLSPDSLAFGEWINESALIDMGFKGNKFTWRRGRLEQTYIAKRLDRVLCCAHTRLKWQEATVTHLPSLSSDHSPLYVQLCPADNMDPSRRPFRFEAAWLHHSGFKELLLASWNGDLKTPEALEGLKVKLRKWNKEIFGDIQRKKDRLVQEIKSVQDLLDLQQTDDLLEREAALIKEFDVVLEQEEVLWFQKSREKWIELGDRNTSYFHTSTIIRRRKNRIEALKNEEGQWVSDKQQLEQLAINYYQRLYSMEDVDAVVEKLPINGFERLTHEEKTGLNKLFTAQEVEATIRSMGKYKAPGPDGFQPVFYQHCWDVVGNSVVRFVLDFFATGELPPDMNAALVVLIAKVAKPEKIMQFRPISLCNVLFKIITKAMVTRLKEVISKLIGPAQASFIPGRLSTDNIVVVQEAVHSMRKKKGRKGWMLLKLDLEKAYDRIRWDFLEDTLKAAGLPDKWVSWIMTCVTGPSMRILWNGEKTEQFTPSRGIRQGDPLSPYLFVLCLERLCHLIDRSVAGKEWKPISISQGGPKLSHICFADDLILFAEASVTQIRVIRRVLERFCVASGQKVSLEKSKIFFSENVHKDLAKQISDESGIKSTKELGKYLGMPILHKRINKETFSEVIERVTSRLSGWKGRFLSMAGRLTLTKSVLSSIPVHTMSVISLPKSSLDRLDRISRDFLWGSTNEKRKQHLVAWTRVCTPKSDGGLGIRAAKDMNKALVSKVGWRLLKDATGLWARVLRSKYKVGDIHDHKWFMAKGNCSATWRSVSSGLREVVAPGVNWVIGDGRTIRFWTDKWLHNKPLQDSLVADLPVEHTELRARDLWIHGTGWNLSQITPYVTGITRLKLAAVVLDDVTGARDRLSWGSADGEFTVKSAHSLLTSDEAQNREWTVFSKEYGEHLGDSALCQICRGGDESILHILRDCPAMEGNWRRIVPARRLGSFFSQSILEWLYGNLGDESTMVESPWSTVFAMAVWWGWKWRCGNIFGSNGRCRDRVKFIKDLAQEVTQAHSSISGDSGSVMRVERLIGWTAPTDGWLKLNTDGASHGNPGFATAGGVLRAASGSWSGGFAVNLGYCSAPVAELWGVYYGLFIAWERRATRVELEVDSQIVVGFLKKGISDSHPLSFLVRLCYGFLSKDWIVRINHVYREANRLVDGLANYAFSLPLGFHMFDVPPDCVNSIMLEDVSGSTRPRNVRFLLLRRECCTFSNGEFVKSGLALLEEWCTEATEEYAGSSWDELMNINTSGKLLDSWYVLLHLSDK